MMDRLSCGGTCLVNCDESQNVACPIGWGVGPTPSPTRPPSPNPTPSPTGGSGDTVSCNSDEQCKNSTKLYGLNIDCNGNQACAYVDSIETASGGTWFLFVPFFFSLIFCCFCFFLFFCDCFVNTNKNGL